MPPDDRAELRAVVGDEAHALDVHVVGAPALALVEHLVVDRHLGALLGHDARAHRGEGAVGDLAGEQDALTRVALDLGDVRALEEITEEHDDLVALGRRARLPVAAERALRDIREVEDLAGDRADGAAAFAHPGVALERRVLEHSQDALDALAELLGGGPGPRGRRREHRAERRESGKRDERPTPGHSIVITYHERPPQRQDRDRDGRGLARPGPRQRQGDGHPLRPRGRARALRGPGPRARRGDGAVVCVSSVAALRGHGRTAYAAAKAGVIGFVRSVAAQLGPQGIRVNAIAPGAVWTPMVENLGPEARERRRRANALGTEGTAWDVGWGAVYLASDQARWVTGQTLIIDGGIPNTTREGSLRALQLAARAP